VSPLEPAQSPLPGRAAGFTGTESGDLFAGKPVPRRSQAARRRPAPELAAARVLCRQLAREQARLEKQRIAHLICLNLRAMLTRPPQRA
jgi:hypothetical protein